MELMPEKVEVYNGFRIKQLLPPVQTSDAVDVYMLCGAVVVQALEGDESTYRKLFDAVGPEVPKSLLQVPGPEGMSSHGVIASYSFFCEDEPEEKLKKTSEGIAEAYKRAIDSLWKAAQQEE